MKKHIAKVLLLALIINLLPFSGASFGAFASEKLPDIIYISDNYEEQVTGKFPSGFYEMIPEIFVEKAPREGEPDNQAIMFKNTEDAKKPLSITMPLAFAPLWEDFVLEFEYMVGTKDAVGKVKMGLDVVDRAQGYRHMQVPAYEELIEIGEKLKISGETITTNEVGKWRKLTLKVDAKTKKADVYIDGKLEKTVSVPNFKNVPGFLFVAPELGDINDFWMADDVNLYLSDRVLTDEEIAEKMAEFKKSEWGLPNRYRTGFLGRMRYFTYEAIRDEFLMSTYGRRAYKDNQYYSFPTNSYSKNNKIYIPLRGFCEMLGAKVNYDNGLVTVDYSGKNLKLTIGESVYYINGKNSQLDNPVELKDGNTMFELDILSKFMGLSYEIIYGDIISFTGDFKSKRRLAPGLINDEHDFDTIIKDRVRISLIFDHPTAEEILTLYREKNPEGSHEKLLTAFYSFDDLRAMYANGEGSEPLFNKAVKTFINTADKEIGNPTGYGNADIVAFAWQMTKDDKYIETINQEVDKLCEQMEKYLVLDWHDKNSNPLQLGNIPKYIARVYDWAYDVLTEESIKKIMDITERYTFPYYEQSFGAQRRVGSFSTLGYPENATNVTFIAKNGALETCIAMMDLYPKRASELLSAVIMRFGDEANTFYPAGYWGEGISYWNMTMPYYADAYMDIESAFGTTFGLADVEGMLKTSDFALALQGSTGATYIFGDGNAQDPYNTWFMYEAKKSNNKALAQVRKKHFSGTGYADIFAWCPSELKGALVNRTTDSFIEGGGKEVVLRSGWNSTDASVAIHAGATTGDTHGHEDVGDVQFDMLGFRWGTAIAKESYNLRDYGFYGTRDGKPETGYGGGDFYRNNAEGHNVVIANMGATRRLMNPSGKSQFADIQFGETMSFTVLDMTETNVLYEKGTRGIKLDKIQNEVTIRDEFIAKEKTDFWWFMHTIANVEIAEDGRTAILTTPDGGKKIWAGILSDGDEKFQVMEAKAMSGFKKHQDFKNDPSDPNYLLRPEGHDDEIVRPPLETPNDGTQDPKIAIGNVGTQKDPIRKLAIHATDTDRFEVSVVFKPLAGDGNKPLIMPTEQPIKDWKIEEVEVGLLNSVTVDGAPLETFVPSVMNYSVMTVTEKDPVPKIEVEADPKYEVEVIETTAVPGITSVLLREKGVISAIYNFAINPINNTKVFHNDRQIPIVAYTTNADYSEDTGPQAMFDGDLTTNFATQSQGGGITADLGEVKKVNEILASFLQGLTRQEHMTVEVSVDGKNFTKVFDGWSSGTSKDLEIFSLGGTHDARYVRILFYGNSKSLWASISELAIIEDK